MFVYIFAAQTSACQTGPKFKTVCQRILNKIRGIVTRSGYFSYCCDYLKLLEYYWKKYIMTLEWMNNKSIR